MRDNPFLDEEGNYNIIGATVVGRTSSLFGLFSIWMLRGKMPFLATSNSRFPNAIDEHMALVLGYKDTTDMAFNWRESSTVLIELLRGEHGWVVYKMLLAKRAGL